MKFLKFRQRSGIIHLIQGENTLFCGASWNGNASQPHPPLLFDKQPSGRICAYCRNRKQESLK